MTNEKEPEIVPLTEEKSIDEKLNDFSDLLKKIENADSKQSQLWLEIYKNATIDRTNAYVMFIKLVRISAMSSTEHATHGRAMSSYIERMQKSNEQLVKLSEMISKADNEEPMLDKDKLYNSF